MVKLSQDPDAELPKGFGRFKLAELKEEAERRGLMLNGNERKGDLEILIRDHVDITISTQDPQANMSSLVSTGLGPEWMNLDTVPEKKQSKANKRG